MSISFYLVRHGQKTSQFESEAVLTELGREQARQTGQYLNDHHIDTIISSPATRARQTAELIAQVCGQDYQVSSDLVERLAWTDRSMSEQEFLDEWNRTCADPHYQPAHGFSQAESRERGQRFITQTVENNRAHQVVLVAHSGIISDIVSGYFGQDDPRLRTNEYCFRGSANCGITQIDFDESGPHLIQLNYTGHLTQVTY